jgi:hypothetical protein
MSRIRTTAEKAIKLMEAALKDRMDAASPLQWRISLAVIEFAKACRAEDDAKLSLARTQENIRRILNPETEAPQRLRPDARDVQARPDREPGRSRGSKS